MQNSAPPYLTPIIRDTFSRLPFTVSVPRMRYVPAGTSRPFASRKWYFPKKAGDAIRKATLVAREIGPTYVQVFAPCPTNMKWQPSKTLSVAKEAEKTYYKYEEYMTDEAEEFLSKNQ